MTLLHSDNGTGARPSPSASGWAIERPEHDPTWRVNRWAEFRDSAIEQGYRAAMLARDRWQSIAGMIVGLLCCTAFIATDPWLHSDWAAMSTLNGFRLALMVVTTVIIFAIVKGGVRRYDPLVNGWLVAVILTVALINAARPRVDMGHVTFDFITLCGIYVVFISRFRLQMLVGFGFSLVMMLSLLLSPGLDRASIPPLAAALVCINFMGGVLTWRLHWLGRRQFAMLLREREWGRQLHRLAHLDPLTEIPNRREFMHSAQVEMERFSRHQRPVALALFDLDHFKQVNDRFGHDVGDQVLQSFAAILEREARGLDVPARLGGEEFVVLLPETDRQGAFAMAQRVQVRTRALRLGPDGEGGCTVSVGITEARPGDQGVDDLLARADRSLYDAKFDGRDRIVSDVILS